MKASVVQTLTRVAVVAALALATAGADPSPGLGQAARVEQRESGCAISQAAGGNATKTNNCGPQRRSRPRRTLPVPYQRVKVEQVKVRYESCDDFLRTTRNKEIASTHPNYLLKPSKAVFEPTGNGYTAEVSTKWALNRARRKLADGSVLEESRIRMPAVSWPNMSPKERDALAETLRRLRVHEQGHIRMADTAAASLKQTVRGSGDTREEARADALAKYKAVRPHLESEAIEIFDAVQEKYDEVVDHGRKQSRGPTGKFQRKASESKHGFTTQAISIDEFPDGKDVRHSCDPDEEPVPDEEV